MHGTHVSKDPSSALRAPSPTLRAGEGKLGESLGSKSIERRRGGGTAIFVGRHRDLDRIGIDHRTSALVMHDHRREENGKRYHDELDQDERHSTPIDLAGGDWLKPGPGEAVLVRLPRRHRAQIEQREAEGRMHEARLHVDAKQHAEPDEIDAESIRRARQQGHDDESELEKIEEEGEEEDEEIDEDEKAELAARQADEQMLDPFVTIDAIEGEREDARPDEDEDHESGKIGGLLERLAQQAEIKLAPGERQQQGAGRSHGAALGRRGDALEDGAENEEDENERRQKISDDLPHRPRHRARRRIEKRQAGADETDKSDKISPLGGDPDDEVDKEAQTALGELRQGQPALLEGPRRLPQHTQSEEKE